jgi:tuftelin-interacting protein 11
MLAAMGYRPGQGLGKSIEGRAEPIPLELKQNRLGLGAINKKAAAREAQRHREREAAGEFLRLVWLRPRVPGRAAVP